jgi:hypothetical protein
MEPLRINATYEDEPQFSELVEQILAELLKEGPRQQTPGLSHATLIATTIYFRLWKTLGLEALAHSDPGLLRASTARTFAQKCEPFLKCSMWNIVASLLPMLERATVLERRGEDWFCPHFNVGGLNQGQAGSHKKKESRGGHHSSLTRSQETRDRVAGDIAMSVLSVTDTAYLGADGQPLSLPEKRAIVSFVLTLERCLKVPVGRGYSAASWPPGFVAKAAGIVGRMVEEDLLQVYHWLQDQRGSSACPRSADECLELWDSLLVKCGVRKLAA